MYSTHNSWKVQCSVPDGTIISYKIELLSTSQIQMNSGGEIIEPARFDEDESEKCDNAILSKGGCCCEDIFGRIVDYTCKCGMMGHSVKREKKKIVSDYLRKVFLSSIFNDKDFSGVDEYSKNDSPSDVLLHSMVKDIELDRVSAHTEGKCKICSEPIVPIQERLKRWGHIKLAAPVVHIWFLNNPPCNLEALLGISKKNIEKVLYFEKYLVTASTTPSIPKGSVLSENAYREANEKWGSAFTVNIGADAMRDFLEQTDLEKVTEGIRIEIADSSSKKKKLKLYDRLKIIEAYIQSSFDLGNIVLGAIPVIPLDLRLISYDIDEPWSEDWSCFSNAINNAYTSVIFFNNRLRRLLELDAPDIIIRNEKRMLQQSVDRLFDSLLSTPRMDEKENPDPYMSLRDNLEFHVDDNPFLNNLRGFSEKRNNRSVSHLIKKALEHATLSKVSGNKDMYSVMVNKLRGLCIQVTEV